MILAYQMSHENQTLELPQASLGSHQTQDHDSRQTILDFYRQMHSSRFSKTHIEYDAEITNSIDFWTIVEAKAAQLQDIYHCHFKRSLHPGERIGISNYRSMNTLSDLIAILFAGGAFVPYDPRDSKERVDYILDDSNSKLSINNGVAFLRNEMREITLKHRTKEAARAYSLLTPCVRPEDLAYIIYTSGSTGKPKGVKISHRALWAYTQWFGKFSFNNTSKRVDFSSSLTFDATITTTLVALANHHSIIICPEAIKKSPKDFLCYLADKKIDLCKTTPSYFKVLLRTSQDFHLELPQKMEWLLTGEEMNPNDCSEWLDSHPHHALYNSYGPTEATVTCSKFKITKANIQNFMERIPIEKDSRSTYFHIVDAEMQEVPFGVKGELCIEGPILADGYQNMAKETAAAFVKGPNGHIWYRTGDLVMRHSDGTIFYFGRQDNQVKIRGIRIELDEVRHAICSLKYVADAMVIVGKSQKYPYLLAFIIPKQIEADREIFRDRVQKDLLRKLPAAMTPHSFVVLDHLPMNKSSKVDRETLLSIAAKYSFVEGKMLVTSPLEMTLLRIWREKFSDSKIGTDSNFFDLGGNSLLAMEVMDRINQHLNTSLPPDLIFQRPNIRQLGQSICDQSIDTNLQHFNHSKEGPALFLIHPDSGMAHLYQCLSPFMKSVDFYALSNDRFGELQDPYKTIEEMASSYLNLVKKHRPKGPYVLGGFCTGGVVAFEMMNQLKATTNETCGVVLIDSFKLQEVDSNEKRQIYNHRHMQRAGVSSDSYLGQRLMRDLEHNRRLAVSYQPRPLFERCLFLQCQKSDPEDIHHDSILKLKDRLNGWESFIESSLMTRVDLNATHQSIFQDEKVIRVLAQEIRRFIQTQ